MSGHFFERIAILGLGLIGGSLALALRNKDLAQEIIGLDRNEESLRVALERKAIHQGTTDFAAGVKNVDLLILAIPVGAMAGVLQSLIPHLKDGCIITDVGSTKSQVVKTVESILPENLYFVGGHPMAGSEKSGMEWADPNLFSGATYLFTPTEKTNLKALESLKELVTELGCQTIQMTPEEHDLAVASISHLPHLLGVSLVSLVEKLGKNNHALFQLAAGGFRDTTRVASSHPVMWRDICLSNKEGILNTIEQFEKILEETKLILAGDNNQEILLEKLEQAKRVRDSIPACQRRDNSGTCYST